MSKLLDEIRKYIGTDSVPIIYYIDAGSIKFFAESIRDPDPLYWDEERASDTTYGGIVAPPTFYGGATSVRNLRSDDPRNVSAAVVPIPPGWVGLNAGDDFELFHPVRPGDTLTCREKVMDAYERQGSSGHLIFIIREKTLTNQHGQVALVRRGTSVLRQIGREEDSH